VLLGDTFSYFLLGLYRISFFQSGRILPDLEWQIRPEPEPDFQIDWKFTNLMCKTLRTYVWFEFFYYFLCSSYHCIVYMHSDSNLCHIGNVSSAYYVIKKYLNNLTSKIPKIDISNPAKLSGSAAPVGFLPVPDLEKVPDSDRSRNPVQPYFLQFIR